MGGKPLLKRLNFLLLLTIAKNVMLCVIVAASLMWVLWWMLLSEPSNNDTKYLLRLDKHVQSRFFRTDDYYGSALFYQSLLFTMVALLSYGVFELRKKIKLLGGDRSARERPARPRLSTYPLVVRGPFGVVTAAEALCAAGVLFLLFYSFGRSTYVYIQSLYSIDSTTFTASLNLEKLSGASYYMGRASMVSFSLLWIPVSRGSPFLRLINIPFEKAIKYHIWLSVLTLFMLTCHSVGYIMYYVLSHTSHEIFEWVAEAESCSVVAGLVAWIAGLIMWATSLSFVRRRWYEVFFGVHHLYIVFFIFWLYHVMWTVHLIVIPCLLFVIDRFVRMVQSRHSVDVLSAKIMESGTLELMIARDKSKGLAYHPLSSWYLRCPSLSKLMKFEWHFFSVISTGMDGKDSLSIVIKPLGKWTTCLRDRVIESIKGENSISTSFKAAVEGPYGDESDFFLRYNVIILIGGGIGVTPLLAVLQDILHRKKLGEDKLPSSIHVYHCVRKQEELCVLNSVDPNVILPQYEKQGLDMRVNVYVTNPARKSSEEDARKDDVKNLDLAIFGGSPVRQPSCTSPGLHTITAASPISLNSHTAPIQGICSFSTSGDSKWMFFTVLASIGGFYILWGLSNVLLVKKYNAPFPNYHRANLVVGSMALGVALFGGMIILFWWSHSECFSKTKTGHMGNTMSSNLTVCQKSSTHSNGSGYTKATHSSSTDNNHYELQEHLTNDIGNAGSSKGSPWNGKLHLQSRPEWRGIFQNLNNEYQGHNIGVLVSGPTSMQEDIAEECRRHSKVLKGASSSNVFHFHSVSFNV